MADNGTRTEMPVNWRRLNQIESRLSSLEDRAETQFERMTAIEARINNGLLKVFESIESLRSEMAVAKHHTMVKSVGKGSALVGAVVVALEAWLQFRGFK